MSMKKIAKVFVGTALTAVTVGVLVNASTALAAGGGCNKGAECLDVYNPVICSNGVVYGNACYARKACATGCVPWGQD